MKGLIFVIFVTIAISNIASGSVEMEEKDTKCVCYDPNFPNLCYCDNYGYQVCCPGYAYCCDGGVRCCVKKDHPMARFLPAAMAPKVTKL